MKAVYLVVSRKLIREKREVAPGVRPRWSLALSQWIQHGLKKQPNQVWGKTKVRIDGDE